MISTTYIKTVIPRFLNMLEVPSICSVSYTHLDVYKRQVVRVFLPHAGAYKQPPPSLSHSLPLSLN